MTRSVFINDLAYYLPGPTVSNDEMEGVLGQVGPNASKTRRLILRSNGIKGRHYALQDGRLAETNAQIAANAIRKLKPASFPGGEVAVLACGTSTPDQLLPSHASMVHGELGLGELEIASFSGACNSGMQALKFAYLSVLDNPQRAAIASGSERCSAFLRSGHFEVEAERLAELSESGYLAFEADFLRWMLSDGSGAVLLESEPAPSGISFRVDWIDARSFAGQLEACMYLGGIKYGPQLRGYLDIPQTEWMREGVFALRQDTKLLGKYIITKGVEALRTIATARDLDVPSVDWFLPHLSSEFFRMKLYDALAAEGLEVAMEKWYTNLSEIGNVGSASPYLMLNGLVSTGRIEDGQKILLIVPESARFSYTFVLLTAVCYDTGCW